MAKLSASVSVALTLSLQCRQKRSHWTTLRVNRTGTLQSWQILNTDTAIEFQCCVKTKHTSVQYCNDAGSAHMPHAIQNMSSYSILITLKTRRAHAKQKGLYSHKRFMLAAGSDLLIRSKVPGVFCSRVPNEPNCSVKGKFPHVALIISPVSPGHMGHSRSSRTKVSLPGVRRPPWATQSGALRSDSIISIPRKGIAGLCVIVATSAALHCARCTIQTPISVVRALFSRAMTSQAEVSGCSHRLRC